MKKPQIVRFAAFVTVLAVLLGYVVYHRTGPNSTVISPVNQTQVNTVKSLQNYFVNYRMKRDQTMTQEIATLQSLLKNPSISQQAKNQASATLVRDTQELKQEMRLEGLLSGRGFPLSAATVTQNQVVVMVGTASRLTSQEVAQIANTAVQVTGMAPQNVVILPKS